MTSLFRPRASFLQNNAWQNQAINALHYNTAQQGSVVPLIYGTVRQQVNVIDFNGYRGPQGKKGKSGSLPISGTHQSGKGSGGGKGKGGKKNAHYTINVDFAICQGPVTLMISNAVYSSSGVETQSVSGLNWHGGEDGQTPDAHFNQVGYSGTCHITGTPMDLGQSPVLPNIAFEITGILSGVHSGGYGRDANPGDIITDFLSNPRYGAEFPRECVSQLMHDDTGTILNTYGDYCQASALLVSMSLDGHQKGIEWLNGLVTLTNSALVWSGKLLKVVPYGDLSLNYNGATWAPDFVSKYNLTDRDFLPWNPRQEGAVPSPGDDDPVMLTRTNPSDADNWVSMEYMDNLNFYNSTTLTSFDQGAIDTYGLRIGDSLPGRAFTNATSAQTALRLILQRRLYIRNTSIKFQLGWQFCLIEPMDMVSISGRFGDNYLNQYAVRVTSIEENDNGDLTIIGEDPQPGVAAPVTNPTRIPAVRMHGESYQWYSELTWGSYAPWGWEYNRPPDGPTGTLSVWINESPDDALPLPGDPDYIVNLINYGLLQTHVFGAGTHRQVLIGIFADAGLYLEFGDEVVYRTPANTISFAGNWQHILITWNCANMDPLFGEGGVKIWINGSRVDVTTHRVGLHPVPTTVHYSATDDLFVYSVGNLLPTNVFKGCTNYLWWNGEQEINDPWKFRTIAGEPTDLGPRGENVTGTPPNLYMAFSGGPDPLFFPSGPGNPGSGSAGYPDGGYWGNNRAGFKPGDQAYWYPLYGLPTGASAPDAGDPGYPNLAVGGANTHVCDSGPSWR